VEVKHKFNLFENSLTFGSFPGKARRSFVRLIRQSRISEYILVAPAADLCSPGLPFDTIRSDPIATQHGGR
jgi:hypothetical protein